MANDLSFNQISTLLNAINQQATGQASLAPVDTAGFVSMATTLLKMGYDPLATAISQVLAKTIFSVRPYSELFKGIRVSNQKYGNHVRKLQVVDRPLVDSKVYDLTDEYAVDHYEVRKPKVLQTNYYGEETFSDFLTIYTVQLDNAMSGPEEFASFISMILQNVEDKLAMSRENLSRMLVSNLIGAKAQADSDNVINLLTAYNDYLGLTSTSRLTVEDVKDPDRYGDFIKFAYAKIKNVSDLMRSRSIKYHMNITGSPIMRHTPYANQRLYISSFDKHMIDTRVLADVFNDEQMKLMDFQPVDFWQSIESPDTVSVIPVYIDSAGELVNDDTSDDQRTTSIVTGVFGVLMDEEAIGYTITLERTERTPLNARGMYYNQFWHDTKKYWTDLTENAVVFILDDESDSGGEGSSDITVESLTATENKTYTAPAGTAYSPVIVNVPTVTVESLNATENTTYTAPEGKAYSPVVVNVPSDFTKATVTITDNRGVGDPISFLYATYAEADDPFPAAAIPETGTSMTGGSPITLPVILYKGATTLVFESSLESSSTITGAEYDWSGGYLTLEGSCSIEFTAPL